MPPEDANSLNAGLQASQRVIRESEAQAAPASAGNQRYKFSVPPQTQKMRNPGEGGQQPQKQVLTGDLRLPGVGESLRECCELISS